MVGKVEKYQYHYKEKEVKMKYTFQNYVLIILKLLQMNRSLMVGTQMLLFIRKRLQFYGMEYGIIDKLVKHNL